MYSTFSPVSVSVQFEKPAGDCISSRYIASAGQTLSHGFEQPDGHSSGLNSVHEIELDQNQL